MVSLSVGLDFYLSQKLEIFIVLLEEEENLYLLLMECNLLQNWQKMESYQELKLKENIKKKNTDSLLKS